MFFSMKLTIQQTYDIKFILSGKSKSEVAKELGVPNSNQFSNLDRYKGLCSRLDDYFKTLNPEIEKSVLKITSESGGDNVLNEPTHGYNTSTKREIDELKLDLVREKKINGYLIDEVERLKEENSIYEEDLRAYDLEKRKKPTG